MPDNTSDSQPVQRVGKKDQKDQIEPAQPLFPQDEGNQDLPDLSNVPMPDVDTQALQTLSALTPDEVRPVIIVDAAERYPPIDPERLVEQPASAPEVAIPSRRSTMLPRFITILMLLATLVVCGIYAIIWIDPQSPVNPLPPATPFAVITATNLPVGNDSVPTSIPDDIDPSLVDSPYPFVVAEPGVLYAPNANGRACNWASIAGSVRGLQGESVDSMAIRIIGAGIDEKVFSGATQTFGPGSFELNLGGVPIADSFTAQLLTAAGAPLSDLFQLTTRADCEANVAIVNFVQIREF